MLKMKHSDSTVINTIHYPNNRGERVQIMKRTIVSAVKRQFQLVLTSALLVVTLLLVLPGPFPYSLTHFFHNTAVAAANPIQIENSNPGTPGWDDFSSVSQQDAVSGYGSSISVNRGQSIDFFVTTTAASVSI